MHTYELDAYGTEEHDSAFCRIGVDLVQDPAISLDPNASTVHWSAPVFTTNAGQWTCIGVMVPRQGANRATLLLKHEQTADGGVNGTAFDDVVLTTGAPLSITSGPTVTEITSTSAKIQWTTNVQSTTLVQYGQGTASSYQFTDCYADPTLQTDHTAIISLLPGNNYIFQAGSAIMTGMTFSTPAEFATPMNESLENTSFEALDSEGRHIISPWIPFQYDINQLPRFYDPTQPSGGPIDGHVGPYPAGGTTWNGITCEADDGSYLIGAYAYMGNKNGGVLQRVKVTPGEMYGASMRFLTHQYPIDSSHPAEYTACAIALDPTGGTDISSPNVVWSDDKTSTVDGQWSDVSVWTTATSDVMTVFCVIEQRYADCIHLNAVDKIVFQKLDASGTIGENKLRAVGMPASIQSGIVTYVKYPEYIGLPVWVYTEEQDRFAAVAVLSTDVSLWYAPPNKGDRISATGTIAIVDPFGTPAETGEAVISNASITITPGSINDVPPPLAMTHKFIGGIAFGAQPGVANGKGLSNVGLLIKTVGKVTVDAEGSGWTNDSFGNTCTYIDDGSEIESGTDVKGIKIIADPSVLYLHPLVKDNVVSVVGISTVTVEGGLLRPAILLRDPADLITEQTP